MVFVAGMFGEAKKSKVHTTSEILLLQLLATAEV